MTGAHYELLRRLSLSDTLPQVSDLRNLLRQVWGSASVASIEDEVKRFPIRIINAGVRDTFHRASEIGLTITPEVEAIAYELEAVRDVVTARTLLHSRPHQESTGANKHFFALEYLESNSLLLSCEQIAAPQTFPTLPVWNSLFRIQDIPVPWELTEGQGHLGHHGDLFPPPPYLVRPSFSSHHPKPRLTRKRIGGWLAGAFYSRMCKRGAQIL